MIAKRSARRIDSQSSFSTLARYIARNQASDSAPGLGVESTNISNCNFDKFDHCLKEIEATQARNTRSKNDKTYHLIVSFPEGEKPEIDKIKDIESVICDGLGFSDHQRISATHIDTKYYHLHIAINKIHPKTHRAIEPYYDKYKLNDLCLELEVKHGLRHDNRIDKEQKNNSNKLSDSEIHSGIESFSSWLKSNKKAISDVISHAKEWKELHKNLTKLGVLVQQSGNGFVFYDISTGIRVKSSSINREFSKPALERILGPFVVSNLKPIKAVNSYSPQPIQGLNSKELWKAFNDEKAHSIVMKKQLLDQLKSDFLEKIHKIKEESRTNKSHIMRNPLLLGKDKKILYSQLTSSIKNRLSSEKEVFDKQKKDQLTQYKLKTWKDWLLDRALTDSNALELLRKASVSKATDLSQTQFLGDNKSDVYTEFKPVIAKNGEVIYQLGDSKIFDRGSNIKLELRNDRDMISAVRFAREKFGDELKMSGNDEFKESVFKAVVNSNQLNKVTFQDPVIENKRKLLLDVLSINNSSNFVSNWINDMNKNSNNNYREFIKNDSGSLLYNGYIKLDNNQNVVLYVNKKGENLVHTVTDKQLYSFKKMKNGSSINVNSHGNVNFKFQKNSSRGR